MAGLGKDWMRSMLVWYLTIVAIGALRGESVEAGDVVSVKVDAIVLGVEEDGYVCVEMSRCQREGSENGTLARQCTQALSRGTLVALEGKVLDFNLESEIWEEDIYVLNTGVYARDGGLVRTVHQGISLWRDQTLKVRAEDCPHESPTRMRFLEPRFGLVTTEESVALKYEVINFHVPRDGYIAFQAHKKGQTPVMIRDGLDCLGNICRGVLTMSGLESGTHVISASLMEHSGVSLLDVDWEDVETYVLIDKIPPQWPETSSVSKRCAKPIEPPKQKRTGGKIRLGYVGTLGFDGQKSIWKSQFERLDRRLYELSFIVFDSIDDEAENAFVSVLENFTIPYEAIPLSFTAQAHGFDALGLTIEALDWFEKSRYLHCTRSSVAVCIPATWELLHLVVPSYALEAIVQMYGSLCGYDIIVFANSQSVADRLLIQVANIAGVGATVMDLPNLFPAKSVEPTVAIAPSNFAASHWSVASIENVRVIHPGVDMAKFSHAHTHSGKDPDIFTIGFVGRLAPEKSPALFVRMAHEMEKKSPVCKLRKKGCKFVVVGDGAVRKALQGFAQHLGVNNLHFLGSLYSGLVEEMVKFDVLINTSLRSHAETFCIVNIESMSLGIPVVSFGAGGVVDYLLDGENGILVRSVSTQGLVNAVERLLLEFNSYRYNEMSRTARDSVRANKLRLEDMVNKYDHLYKTIG